jgi:hypothetical protein
MNRLNRFFVRRGWKAVLLLLLPICPAFGDAIAACPSTTFNVYISKYQNGCSVGPLIFSNFTWSSYTVPPAGRPNAPDPIASDKVDVSQMNRDKLDRAEFQRLLGGCRNTGANQLLLV